MRRVIVAFFAFLAACGPPRYVESTEQIDSFLARGNYAYACVGLAMDDAYVRKYTAEALARYQNQPEVGACLCAEVYDKEAGSWDKVIAGALAESRFDAVASCLAAAVDDGRITDRAALVEALGNMLAPAAYDALEKVARQGSDPELRAAAVKALRSSPPHADYLKLLLSTEKDDTVRAAAASALEGRDPAATREALLGAITSDASPEVRKRAIEVLGKDTTVAGIDAVCKALTDDADPTVRAAAAAAFSGTMSQRASRCLIRKVQSTEDDGTVREAVLDAIWRSSREEVSDALCKEIGPYVRRYIKDKIGFDVPGGDIVRAQNNNHWESSYACVERALAQGGYSCYGRNYLAHWFNELGGKATPPLCPGMVRRQ